MYADREKRNAYVREYRKRNLEKLRKRGCDSERKRRMSGKSTKAWERANPEKVTAQQHRAKCKRYGITVIEYDRLEHAQNALCAICGSPEPRTGVRLSIDHDHRCCPGRRSCGRCVRGLLCSNCNPALGGFQDSAIVLQNAARYLHSYPLATGLGTSQNGS